MTPAAETTLTRMLAESPPGDAFSRKRESLWARTLAPLAAEHARIEGEADAMVLEVDPRSAPRMLDGYERVLGDDPCLGPAAALPLEIRQALAHQRWTMRGVARPADFIALAVAMGVAITIEESKPFRAGLSRAGERLGLADVIFEWRVHLPAVTQLVEFRAGVSRAGERLGTFAASPVECLIRARAPAHTAVYFSYGS